MEYLIQNIKSTGKLRKLNVNTPFMLDDPDKVWYIDEGNINIYTVRLKDNQPEGKRFYFFNAREGHILMGFDSRVSTSGIGFLADATEDTTVYELDFEQVKSWMKFDNLRAPVVELIEEWIENLLFGISENANHPNLQADVLIKEGEMVILRNGENISAQKNLVWAKISSNKLDSILINGTGKVASEEKDLLLPVSRRSFLQSTRNVGMRFYRSNEALQDEAAWEGIRSFDETILSLEKSEIELVQEKERTRLKEKYEYQFQDTVKAIKNAQAILNRKEADKYAESIGYQSEDILFNACQVVANHSGIKLTPAYESSTSDPIGDIVRSSRIRYREVLLEGEWWLKDGGAFLGFMKESGTPVAIMPLNSKKYEVYDAEQKTTFEVNERNADQIDKLAYTFYKPFPEKKLTVRDLLWFGIFKSTSDFYILLLMGLLAAGLELLTPVATGLLFDFVIPNASIFQIVQICFGLLMALLGYILFNMTESYALLRIETKMDSRLQAAVWDRLLNLPVSFFKNFSTGDLADRTMGIGEIRNVISGVVITSILGSLFSFLNFILLFYYSPLLALIALGLVLVEMLIFFLIGKWQISRERLALDYKGRTQGMVLQLLTGINKFRVTGTEIKAFIQWLSLFSKSKQYAYEATRVQNMQSVINSITPVLFSLVIYAALIQLTDAASMTTGEFLAFNAAYGAFTAAMLALSSALLSFFQIFPIFERTKPILTTLPESDSGKANPGKLKGNIEVNQANFRYEKDGILNLQDISFTLSAGDYVAFVGPSGSGKSTLVRLLLGFEKPESGSIYFDEQELGQLDLRLVRRQIGVVLQEGQLTPGDILSNIIGSSPSLTIEEAWEAAKMAGIEEDIKQMPMGMHTIISEGATTLSGGQKQRLLIAQTLVHKPRIIIFDEATSSLDNRTQSIVTSSLGKLQATRIVIAHRLSTIKDVDKIFVLDKGRIVQTGTYDELMATEGAFRALAARQIE